MDEIYTAPSVVELGTVAELTQKLNSGTHLDSNFTGTAGPLILS